VNIDIPEASENVADLAGAHAPKIRGSLPRVAVRELVKSGKAIEQMVGSLAGKVAGVQHNEGVAALIDAAFSNAARYRTAIFE